jgi:L-amino acid N-acyltransferase YncA
MTITVRAAAPADAPAVAAIYAPVVTATATSFEEQPPTPDEMGRRMLARPRLPWLVADDDGRVAGYAYAAAHRGRPAYRWSAESSVYLDPAYQGRGLGRQLYERLITEVRDLGYRSLYAGIALPNPASVGLHEALGFTPVGIFRDVGYKLGAWRDVGWWQCALADRDTALDTGPDTGPDIGPAGPDGAPAEPRSWTA